MTFSPYEIDHGIEPLRFLVATEQARGWYDPIKEYARLEYEWLLANVDLDGARVIDGGAHHGHYSLVFALAGAHVTAVDPHRPNLDILAKNMALNGFKNYQLVQAAIWHSNQQVWFSGQPNGMVGGFTGVLVAGMRPYAVDPSADVIKLDIEGAEFVVLPEMIQDCPVRTWIVELHLSDWRQHNWPSNPNGIARLFKEDGYKLDWVNRETMHVERYKLGTVWKTHSTLIARR